MKKEAKEKTKSGMDVPVEARRFELVRKGFWPFATTFKHLRKAKINGEKVNLADISLNESFTGFFHVNEDSKQTQQIEVRRVA